MGHGDAQQLKEKMVILPPTCHHVPIHVPAASACYLAQGAGAWWAGQTKLWATHTPQSHVLVASVDTAEEKPAKIAAVQKKEPTQEKKCAWKKPGRWLPTCVVVRRRRLLVLDLMALLPLSGHGLALDSVFTNGLTGLGPASVWPPAPGRETRFPRAA